jgi:hypothetical protein
VASNIFNKGESNMAMVRRLAVMMAVGILFVAAGPARGEGTVLDKVPQDTQMVIVIKDQAAADAKLDELVGLFMPQPPAGPDAPPNALPAKPKMELIKKLQKELLGSPELVKANSPLVLLVTFQGETSKEPLSAALVEVTDFKALVGDAKADENGIYLIGGKWAVAQYGGLVLMGEHEEGVLFYKKMAPGVKLAAGEMELWNGSDAFVACNLAAVVQTYTPAFQKARAEMLAKAEEHAVANVSSGEAAPKSATSATGSMAAAEVLMQRIEAAKRGERKNAAEAQVKMLDQVWDLANQADWAAESITLDGAAIDQRYAFAAKPGTKLAGYLSDHPALGAKLSPDLPKGDCWAVGWYSFDGPRVMKMAGDLCGLESQFMGSMSPFMGQQGPLGQMKDMYAKIQTMIQSKSNLVVGQGAAAAYTASSGGLFNVAGVTVTKDPAANRAFMDDNMNLVKEMLAGVESATSSEGVPMPVKVKISYDKDVQKIGDLSVDRFKETFVFAAPAEGAGPMGLAMVSGIMKNLLGSDSIIGWITYSDSYCFSQIGPNPDRLADLVKTAKDGGGLADEAALKELRKHTVKEANAVAFVSVSHFTNLMFWNVMSAMTGMPLPPMDSSGSRSKAALSLSANHGMLTAELYMPAGETGQLATTVQGVIQRVMAMQQGMQPKQQHKMPMPDDMEQ